jgi:hypothetical protein
MLNYKQARIYTVRCRRNHTWIYVGSTTRPLSRRFAAHKTQKTCALYKFIHEHCGGDWSDWYIELYEQNGYDNKEQLTKREGEVMREISTINRNIAGRTIQQYRIDNKDKFKLKYIFNKNKKKIYYFIVYIIINILFIPLYLYFYQF